MTQQMSEQQPTFMSEKAAASLLGVSRFVLHGARQRGEIGYVQLGGRIVYGASHIQEYIRRCERPAVANAA
jgi:hypothetical protein